MIDYERIQRLSNDLRDFIEDVGQLNQEIIDCRIPQDPKAFPLTPKLLLTQAYVEDRFDTLARRLRRMLALVEK